MLATLASEPFSDPKWLFEPKLDGFRILAFIRRGEVTLLTRNGNDFTSHYPWVAQDLAAYSDSEMVVDGEMAALNDKGVPDFNLMQHSAEIAIKGLRLEGEYPIVYYPFDLLHLDGKSLLNLPLHERKGLLKESLRPRTESNSWTTSTPMASPFSRRQWSLGWKGRWPSAETASTSLASAPGTG